jgi:pSer/pThr/pTyr-binding forkhead associated (FHA) protein
VAFDDVLALAMHMNRASFAARFPDAILVGDGAIITPAAPTTMTMMPALSWDDTTFIGRKSSSPLPTAFLCAVRRIKPASPNPIAVGRSPHNDIVIPDESVSKVHAHFHTQAGQPGLALSDATSRNGTWCDGVELIPGADPVPVAAGTRLRFGLVELTLVDSGIFWDRIRTPTSFG